MKEITRIHIAGVPFNSELAAKRELEAYLAAIHTQPDVTDEVVSEIEGRMVELLAEHSIKKDGVITEKHVTQLKQQLGEPQDFTTGEPRPDAPAVPQASSKVLMRDPRHGWLGGVLAGIATYTNVNVVLLRLAVLILLIPSFGTIVFIYFLLWLLMPAARTAADELLMQGEAVTLGAITEKARGAQDTPAEGTKPAVIALRIVAGVALAVMALGALFATIFGGVSGFSHMPEMMPTSQLSWLGPVALVCAIIAGLLLVVLCGLTAALVLLWRFSRRWLVILASITLAGIVAFTVCVSLMIVEANSSWQHNQRVSSSGPDADVRPDWRQMPQLAGATSLRVPASKVDIYYTARPHGQTRLRVIAKNGDPAAVKTTMTRSGSQAQLAVDTSALACHQRGDCDDDVTILVEGPALNALDARGGDTVTYRNQAARPQAKLDLQLSHQSDVYINSDVTDLHVTTPEQCQADDTPDLHHKQVRTLTVNGGPAERATAAGCIEINS